MKTCDPCKHYSFKRGDLVNITGEGWTEILTGLAEIEQIFTLSDYQKHYALVMCLNSSINHSRSFYIEFAYLEKLS